MKNPILGAELAARPFRSRSNSSYAKWCKVFFILSNMLFNTPLMQEIFENENSREDPEEEKTQVNPNHIHEMIYVEKGRAGRLPKKGGGKETKVL